LHTLQSTCIHMAFRLPSNSHVAPIYPPQNEPPIPFTYLVNGNRPY
jgi:hypothetical protein